MRQQAHSSRRVRSGGLKWRPSVWPASSSGWWRPAPARRRPGPLCQVAADLVAVTGAGVMILADGVPQASLCTTGGVAALIEELQYTLGEGPCIDAYRTGTAISEPDLVAPVSPRWPAFTPKVIDVGARAIFGFPVRIGAARIGALNLYRDRPGPLSDDQHADALVMADVIARTVLTLQADTEPGSIPAELEQPTFTPRSTRPPGWSRSNSTSASPTPWSAYAPTPSPPTGRSPRWPGRWSPARCASTISTNADPTRRCAEIDEQNIRRLARPDPASPANPIAGSARDNRRRPPHPHPGRAGRQPGRRLRRGRPADAARRPLRRGARRGRHRGHARRAQRRPAGRGLLQRSHAGPRALRAPSRPRPLRRLLRHRRAGRERRTWRPPTPAGRALPPRRSRPGSDPSTPSPSACEAGPSGR